MPKIKILKVKTFKIEVTERFVKRLKINTMNETVPTKPEAKSSIKQIF